MSNFYNGFSVSMCVYYGDRAAWVRKAIESVINQTLCPNEVIIVVDGPIPDELHKVLNDYENNPIFNIVYKKENLGHGEARRTGLKLCKNELVAIMDSDDICVPNRFEKQLDEFKKNRDLAIVGGYIGEFIQDEDKIIARRTVPLTSQEIHEFIKYRCPFNQPTVMFKKSLVDAVGGYKDWFCNEDYYLWIRMHLRGLVFKNIPETLVKVRVGVDMYRRRGGWRYFLSEFNLQKFMLKNRMISLSEFFLNIIKRFIIQILVPPSVRSILFQKFAREKVKP